MSMENFYKLNDICLFVDDFEESVKFYEEKMGCTAIRHQPGYIEFSFKGAHVTLWDVKGVQTAIPKDELGVKGSHFMLAVKVPELNEVDEISDELISRGVPCISEPQTYEWGSRAAYFKDNSGNIWEIFAWVEGDGPGLDHENK